MKTSPSLAVVGSPLVVVLIALALSMLAAGCRSSGGSGQAPTPTFTTDTVRARNIELVDEKGRVRLFMSGQRDNWGPTIVFRDENADDKDADGDAVLILSLRKTGPNGDGPTMALIHAESADFGAVNIAVDSDGAHLELATDDAESLGMTCDKGGLMVSVVPKVTGPVDPSLSAVAKSPVPKEARGMRITLDHGRIVVHDLAGNELGALPDPAPSAPTAPH